MHIDLAPQCDASTGCITCADEGIEMQVIAIGGADGLMACADADGGTSEVDITLVEPVEPGDRVLVHAGVAIARLAREAVEEAPT
jgi:hydrogenase maturation factor